MSDLATGIGDEGSGEQLDVMIPALMGSMRVDRALSMLTGCSRSDAARLIESGAVVVDGSIVVKASVPLKEGSHLEALIPAPPDDSVAPEPDVALDVVFEDDDLVIVDKPFDLVVHPGAGNRTGTLVAGLIARYPDMARLPDLGFGELGRPGIVHRLDKGTSGLLVAARTPVAFTSLSAQLAEHLVERRYVGIVEGHVESARGIVDAPIGRSINTPTRMAVRPDGKEALTRYEVLGYLSAPDRTVVGLTLETGRTHQIRVHMAAIGHAIVNDPRYGQRNERRIDHDRLALHAGRLSFTHPTTGEAVVAVAPWPRDLGVLGGSSEASEWLSPTP